MAKAKEKIPLTRWLYGDGYISAGDVKEQIAEVGGDIVVHMVEDQGGDGDAALVYGLFYQHPEGYVFDVVQNDLNLKTYNSADRMAPITAKYGLKSLNVPLGITEAIKPGELRKK